MTFVLRQLTHLYLRIKTRYLSYLNSRQNCDNNRFGRLFFLLNRGIYKGACPQMRIQKTNKYRMAMKKRADFASAISTPSPFITTLKLD
jgi:hypothetical protein